MHDSTNQNCAKRHKAPIWRRVLVPAYFTLHDLHLIIQAAMGWTNYHLYSFSIGNERFSIPYDSDKEVTDSRTIKLGQVYSMNKESKMHYTYDFGDCWEHEVTIEKSLEETNGEKYPQCIDGARACPLEDCSGVPGYYELVEAFANPKAKKYSELREWARNFAGGNYDPEAFDLKEANENVRDYKDMEV
ncbi:MAG: plasmid pRiA4b ORF-3 family protein [Candidatus Micrarchaeaceae archaeon]